MDSSKKGLVVQRTDYIEDQYGEQRLVPDDNVVVCAKFGCATHLSLQEKLAGKYCWSHSPLIKKSFYNNKP
jgi:hypothetical protein